MSYKCYVTKRLNIVVRAESLHSELEDMGIKIPEETLVGKIVTGLTKKYLNFMTSWSQKTATDQRLSILVPQLIGYEQLTKQFTVHNDSAFTASKINSRQNNKDHNRSQNNKNNNNYRNNNYNKNKNSYKPRNNNESNDNTDGSAKRSGQCRYCKKYGHFKRECPKLVGRYIENHQVVEVIDDKTTEDKSFTVEEVNVASTHGSWMVDSGATSHMTYDRNDFVTYEEIKSKHNIIFGNKGVESAIGIGHVKIYPIVEGNVEVLTLHNVLHVPSLSRKLISVTKATQNGCKAIFEDNVLVIKNKNGQILCRGF